MQKYQKAVMTFFVIGCCFFIVCSPAHKNEPLKQAHQLVQQGLNSLGTWLQAEWEPLLSSGHIAQQQASFAKGRLLYKKIEWAIEYFYPNSARQINGPALPEIEAEEHIVLEPGGFQVMEEMLYVEQDTATVDGLVRETNKLKSILVRVRQLWEGHQWRNDQVFDALRLELYRIITLGISGFDTPVSLTGIGEASTSLQSVQAILQFYDDKSSLFKEINVLLDRAKDGSGISFDAFDRMVFIRRYINPLTQKVLQWQQQLKIPVLTGISALRGDAPTIFAAGAFDVNYFTPDASSRLTDSNVALGRRLFYDKVLSDGNTVACASCHNPDKAFTDGVQKSHALGSNGFLMRNTPSLINAGLQRSQFYDMRATYLEDQVKNVVENKDEIHGSLLQAARKLQKDSNYFRAFKNAFGNVDTLNERVIMIALASYVRSLTSLNTRFDKYMRGDTTQMNNTEIAGFNLFMGKAKCGICHFMPLFNGTVPPAFVTTESEVIGVPATANSHTIDADLGRYSIYKIPNFKYSFKTPGLRNIALTAPYMHNGVFSTLDQVIDFYDKGGGNALGMLLEYQTLPADSLKLTSDEKRSLVAFLHTLNDSIAIAH